MLARFVLLLSLLGLSHGAVDTTLTHFTWMDIGVDGEFLGRIEFGLYGNAVPKTAENFRALCTGEKGIGSSGIPLNYEGMIFHRVIPDFICQGGDFVYNNGVGGDSIYGPQFDDENFDVKHTKKGQLSMANWGKDTNKSQFSIMMAPMPHLDNKHVVFGEVVNGWDVVRAMNSLGDDESEKAIRRISVLASGEINDDTPAAPKSTLLEDLSYCLDDENTASRCMKWSQPCKIPTTCKSGGNDCCGQCTANYDWMHENCCASCSADCQDKASSKDCASWASPCKNPSTCASGDTDCCNQCVTNTDWMMKNCCRTCRRLVAAHSTKTCEDDHGYRMDCLQWAQPCTEPSSCTSGGTDCCGQCESNEEWMNEHCCGSCKAVNSVFEIPVEASNKQDDDGADEGDSDSKEL